MLKKEHILCKINSGNVKPGWFAPETPEHLECAATLISLYQQSAEYRMSADELAQLAKNAIDSSSLPKVSAGLNKLLLDRCEFKTADEFDYPALRRELFQKSAAMLKAGSLPQPFADKDIYGDLPGFEKIERFSPITPVELINHFNLAQAQALLIYAKSVTLKISDPDVSELRKVMKAVKFFRLLAQFVNAGKNCVEITVSGPFALFGPTAKYAISLSALLPVVVNLKKWTLQAEIIFRERSLKLKLNEKSRLHSTQRAFSTYLPEEIRLYHRHFAEKSTDWQIVGNTPFLDAGNQEIIFPDLSFQSAATGQIIHLELFHRWHSAQLQRRLELLKQHPELPLILGIDRSAADEKFLAGYESLQNRFWLFRDFPGVENTLRALKKQCSIDIPDSK